MHVLWLPSWFSAYEGDMAGSFFTEQSAALAADGLQVGVLAPQPKNLVLPRRTQVRLSQENGVGVVRFVAPQVVATTRRLSTRWAAPALHAAYAAYVHAHGKPDVLHAHSLYPGAFFAAHLSRRERIPFIYTEHRSLTHMPTRSWVGKASERAVVAAATHRTAVSHGHAEHLARRFGSQAGPWLYTPNLLPLAGAGLEASKSAGQAGALHFPDGSPPRSAGAKRGPVVGHLSLLGEEKRTDLIIAAFEDLHASWRDCGSPPASRPLLRIAGPTDGPDGQRTSAQVAASPARESIELTGLLDRAQIPAFCASLDVFMLPSDTETFGVAAIEALAQGTPVIATRTWGGRSVVQEGDGLIVPIGDAAALSAALRTLLAGSRADGGACSFTPEPARARAERAERCVNRFGAAAWLKRWREIYQQAATSSR